MLFIFVVAYAMLATVIAVLALIDLKGWKANAAEFEQGRDYWKDAWEKLSTRSAPKPTPTLRLFEVTLFPTTDGIEPKTRILAHTFVHPWQNSNRTAAIFMTDDRCVAHFPEAKAVVELDNPTPAA